MSARSLPRGFFLLIGVAMVATVLVVAALTRDYGVDAAAEPSPPAASTAPAVEEPTTPAPLAVPDGARSVFFGDSWTAALGIEPVEQGYAYLAGDALGWDNTVHGVGSTGYLDPGPDGPDADLTNAPGTYQQRLAALPVDPEVDVVILQGSVNDRGYPLGDLMDTAAATFDQARQTYPEATIVVLGPAPAKLPADDLMWAIDDALRAAAAVDSLHYISPLTDEWITGVNYEAVVSEELNFHPHAEGHAYLAARTAEAIRALG